MQTRSDSSENGPSPDNSEHARIFTKKYRHRRSSTNHGGPRSRNKVKYCGFVLVAGGLGERLGYGDIKLRLPSETCTMTTYLQLYIRQILHLQSR